jgi:uncharacterized membrane protein
MHGWFVAASPVGPRRAIPGGYVLETAFIDIVAHVRAPSGLLQTAGGIGGMIMAGALVLVLGLVAVAVWQGRVTETLQRVLGSTDSPETSQAATEPVASDETAVEDTHDGTDTVTQPSPPEQELTDREFIVDILEDNDGRMKQARIVDSTGWSKSKVSMLLSEMEDEGEISKLRVGRENIISLSGEEPDAAGSPFDSS